MLCILCHEALDLFDLADFMGLPAHGACARTADQLAAEALAEAEAIIMAEPDPRRHRKGLHPGAAPAG